MGDSDDDDELRTSLRRARSCSESSRYGQANLGQGVVPGTENHAIYRAEDRNDLCKRMVVIDQIHT